MVAKDTVGIQTLIATVRVTATVVVAIVMNVTLHLKKFIIDVGLIHKGANLNVVPPIEGIAGEDIAVALLTGDGEDMSVEEP